MICNELTKIYNEHIHPNLIDEEIFLSKSKFDQIFDYIDSIIVDYRYRGYDMKLHYMNIIYNTSDKLFKYSKWDIYDACIITCRYIIDNYDKLKLNN